MSELVPVIAPLITQDMDGSDSKSLSLQRQYSRLTHIPWKNVRDAIKQGYIYPGWSFTDYLRATDKGNPNLGLHCSCGHNFYDSGVFAEHLETHPEHKAEVRKPFEYCDVWGVQGASKSAFVLQKMASLYDDWYIPIDRMLLEKDMLISAYEEVPEPTQRIPVGCLDDLNTIISKQEWFIDKEFYILFHKFLNTIRTKFGTLFSTLPNVEFTPEMLGDVVTFEVIIYPNSTYKVERYCWDINPFEPIKAKFTKIVVEQATFDIYDTPNQVWQLYQHKRLEVANKLFTEMKDYMESGGKAGRQVKENTLKAFNQGFKGASMDGTIEEWKTKTGAKLGVKDARELLRTYQQRVKSKTKLEIEVE